MYSNVFLKKCIFTKISITFHYGRVRKVKKKVKAKKFVKSNTKSISRNLFLNIFHKKIRSEKNMENIQINLISQLIWPCNFTSFCSVVYLFVCVISRNFSGQKMGKELGDHSGYNHENFKMGTFDSF